MPAPSYRGAIPPSVPTPRVYDVIGVTPDVQLDVTILDGAILGTNCHWQDACAEFPRGRSRLCHHWEGECPWHNLRQIWIGWLAVYEHAGHKRAVLRLGPDSAKALAKMAGQYVGLRGLRVLLKRTGRSTGSSLLAEKAQSPPLVPLIDAHSIDATVCRVLCCERLPDWRADPQDIPGPEGFERSQVK